MSRTMDDAGPVLGLLLVLALLDGGVAAAQSQGQAQGESHIPAPVHRINRNPAFRGNLPPGPPVPVDPRDSTTRPVMPPGSDERDATDPAPELPDPSLPDPATYPYRPLSPASSPR